MQTHYITYFIENFHAVILLLTSHVICIEWHLLKHILGYPVELIIAA